MECPICHTDHSIGGVHAMIAELKKDAKERNEKLAAALALLERWNSGVGHLLRVKQAGLCDLRLETEKLLRGDAETIINIPNDGKPVGNGKAGWQKCTKRPVTIEFREAVPGEVITTIEGTRITMTTDHLVMRGTRGEIYPITKAIFHETYEKGEPATREPSESDWHQHDHHLSEEKPAWYDKPSWYGKESIICTCGHPGSIHLINGACIHKACDGKNTPCICKAFKKDEGRSRP